MKWLDLPPVWLAASIAIAWAMAGATPGLTVLFPGQRALAVLLALAGLLLMVLAVWTMVRARTTFVPRRDPAALVTSGVFRLSRNPIYLADILMLLAAILWWGAVIALPLVPLLAWIIRRRFIDGEERRVRAGFGQEYEAWAAKTRRWL
jgi:protein-S-isoprenylcysteine O-methyltransferase Ste14